MSEVYGGVDGDGLGSEQYNSPMYAESVLRRLASLRGRGLSSDQIADRIALTHPELPGGGTWDTSAVTRLIRLVDAGSVEPTVHRQPTEGSKSAVPPKVAPAITTAQAPPELPSTSRAVDRTTDVVSGRSAVNRLVVEPEPVYRAPQIGDVGHGAYEPKPTKTAGRLLTGICGLLVVGIVATVAWSQGLIGGGESAVLSSEQEAAQPSSEALGEGGAFDAVIADLPEEPPSADTEADEDLMIIRIEPPSDDAESGLVPASATIRNDGKLHVEGAFVSEVEAQAFLNRAGDVFGSENIVQSFFIDPEAPEPSVSDVALDKPVLFQSGSAEIDPEYIPFLEACGDVLRLNPSIVMSITAYTDSQGGSGFNLELSRARANAIVEFYRELEIDESQLVGVGLGEEQAFADNTTEAGRQQNRRAMLQLMNVMGEG